MPVTDEFHGRAPLYFCFIILMTMNGEFKHIFKVLLPGVLLTCMALLSSCADDAGDSDRHGSTATLQMQVSTRAEGDQTGTEDKQPGGAYENIHSICVLLVNSQGNVAWKYINDNLSDDASETEYLSEPIQDLPLGTYDVYAFANFDYYTDGAGGAAELWTTLKNLVEGDPFDESKSILSLVVDDPASKINFDEKRYIPMSGKKEDFNVTATTSIIPVQLDRLVSKVRITVSGESAKDVTELTFSGWADKVTLFSDGTLSGNVSYEDSITVGDKTVDENRTVVVSPFYVNETPDGHTFNVSVKTNESTAGNPQSVYTATTKQSGLPRNHIYPLAITINNWGLDITAQCWLSPIGALPQEVRADFETGTYNISIPEGAQFEFTLGGLEGKDNSTATWSINPDNTPGIAFENYTDGLTTVKGHVTASAGKTFSLGVTASFTENGLDYKRTYTVKLKTVDIFDAEFKTTRVSSLWSPFTCAAEWGGARNVLPEVLDIHVKR